MRATGGEFTERRNSSFPACDWRECYDVTRAELFTRESNRHPAKMAVGLCFKIFQHGQARGYWKPGDCILDPMAGIFTTGVCGAVLGYRVLGVELEPHFIELAEGNIEFSRSKWHPKGDAVIVRGDARNLTGTVSGAVSSPPYADAQITGAGHLRDPSGDIDAVLSSPPYANQMSTERQRGRGPTAHALIIEKKIEHNCYGKSDGQIGNANDETYLSAMFQVYSELHRVLRRGGVVALVTKNPVKNKQIRRLDLDTITLMERAGFSLIERFRAMLTRETQHGHLFGGETIQRTERKSFFKRLYERKNPGLRVDWEDVLIFRSRR